MTDRLAIGGNLPPVPTAEAVTQALAESYPHLSVLEAGFANELALIPDELGTKADHDAAADLLTRIRGRARDVEATRVAEKDPFLKAERGVDGFFQPINSALIKQQMGLNRQITAYLSRKAAEERQAREAAAATARAAEQAARDRAMEEARKAQEARRADYRASHTARADSATLEAASHQETAFAADQMAQAKPADLARTRTEVGTLSTLKSEWTFEIDDWDKVSIEALKPYIDQKTIEKAIRSAVRIGLRSLSGVRIYETEKAMVR